MRFEVLLCTATRGHALFTLISQPLLGKTKLSEGDQVQIYGSAKQVEKFARLVPRP